MLIILKSLVRPHLEYVCPIWNPTKVCDIMQLENIHKSFLKRICNLQNMPYHEILKKLQIMSLQRRRERYVIILMFKILHNLCPNDPQIRFRPESRTGIQAYIPPLRRCSQSIQSKYDSSFAVLGPKLWNVLPCSLQAMQRFDTFKNQLTKFCLLFLMNLPCLASTRPTETHCWICELSQIQLICYN